MMSMLCVSSAKAIDGKTRNNRVSETLANLSENKLILLKRVFMCLSKAAVNQIYL
jgi:hypothetical protein